MTQEGSTAAAADKKKKRSAKKKRKISKHILQANKDHVELQKARDTEDNVPDIKLGDATPMVTPAKKVGTKKRTSGKKKQANTHTKDIKEAAGYLSNWKHHKDSWKFNKNTQSWLIRHMYEADKVSKSTFSLLLEYLEGLKGEGAKTRILEEATRRALRYKKYSEEKGGDSKDGNKEEDDDKKNNTKSVSFSEDTKEESSSNDKKKEKQLSQKEQQAAMDEQTRWENLDDHDKRKEYKRARKVLETLRDAASSEKQSGGESEQ